MKNTTVTAVTAVEETTAVLYWGTDSLWMNSLHVKLNFPTMHRSNTIPAQILAVTYNTQSTS